MKILDFNEFAQHGGVMIYLGSDDEAGMTSLYGTNLYIDSGLPFE